MADKRRVSESEQLVNLWGHEATRTFSDRLVNLEDKEWFVEQIKAAVKTHFNMNYAKLRGGEEGKARLHCDPTQWSKRLSPSERRAPSPM